MLYEYRGGLAAPNHGGFSAGLSSASPGTGWQSFSTSIPITIADFKGFAHQSSVGAQLGRGPSAEIIWLFGPAQHGASWVHLGWWGLWEKGGGVGAGSDSGDVDPVAGPDDARLHP